LPNTADGGDGQPVSSNGAPAFAAGAPRARSNTARVAVCRVVCFIRVGFGYGMVLEVVGRFESDWWTMVDTVDSVGE